MRNISAFRLLAILIIILLNLNSLSSQSIKNDITLILKKYDTGNFFATSPDGGKYIEFKISGLNNQSQVDTLVKHLKGSRGVVSATISSEIKDNQRTGKINLYKFADNMQYYRYLFLSNGIKNLIIDGKEILTESLPVSNK